MSGTIVLLRHGESTANAAETFTGVSDAPLTARGRREAAQAARLLRATGMTVGATFASELTRATDTAAILAQEGVGPDVALRDWQLNERNYGALTGRSKTEILAEHGPALFREWRRSVHAAPPPLTARQIEILRRKEPFRHLPAAALTATESLFDVIARVRQFHGERARPRLQVGVNVLVVAHGNSLRAYCAVLDDLTEPELEDLNLPTGQPLVYRLTADGAPRVRGGEYLDPITARQAAATVARQGGT
ncbi:2,3-bisphosphoglycerate-dependent phosphoglycerate mutase [Microbacterium sp. C5A9]|uniref:2,3-bisphosphoglycerate-dependent phosphoglycerate mutase n=2 Tax=unclassified Microbacterium TaxID=2609290 RepID=UPI001F51D82F|nr:2,3-bisphosphoglycerate-dependent phosphoglycerate mutase [Microbacterium sp. C5A9]MCI1019756.1 2,3-bisphosphoglycerate-dependent phosphoglycerate mutase [Microbacterium sp. C5A9]